MQHAASDPPVTNAHDGVPRDAQTAVSAYRHMVRLRLLSARMVLLERAGAIASHHPSIGEEAAIVGPALACRPGDWIFPGAREWGAALVRGVPLVDVVHQAFGSAKSVSKGHAPADYVAARALRVAPASGIPGAHLPQAVGCAWAAKIRKDDVATLALFGGGVTSGGDFHNAMNFAGVFKAPCVLVCRSDTREGAVRETRSDSFAAKAVAYGVASAAIDGDDVLAVLALARAAFARIGEGRGPTLLEVRTRPVTTLDDATLAGDAVLGAGGDADPIVRLRRVLERDKLLDSTGADAFVREVRAEIDSAVAAAEAAGPPAPATIFEDVYARRDGAQHLTAQEREMSSCRR